MNKCFRIKWIYDVDQGRKAELLPLDTEERFRILNLNPLRDNEASGIEFDVNGDIINNVPGYILKGNKPLNEWEANDIVCEEVYPEKFDL